MHNCVASRLLELDFVRRLSYWYDVVGDGKFATFINGSVAARLDEPAFPRSWSVGSPALFSVCVTPTLTPRSRCGTPDSGSVSARHVQRSTHVAVPTKPHYLNNSLPLCQFSTRKKPYRQSASFSAQHIFVQSAPSSALTHTHAHSRTTHCRPAIEIRARFSFIHSLREKNCRGERPVSARAHFSLTAHLFTRTAREMRVGRCKRVGWDQEKNGILAVR